MERGKTYARNQSQPSKGQKAQDFGIRGAFNNNGEGARDVLPMVELRDRHSIPGTGKSVSEPITEEDAPQETAPHPLDLG